jgi:hypothetical protein
VQGGLVPTLARSLRVPMRVSEPVGDEEDGPDATATP